MITARPQARVALGRVRRQKIRHYISESRRHSVIANLQARLVETEDMYWATISAINESFINIPESIVRQYPMLLSGGMGGTIELTYDETEVHGKKIRPFKVTEFIPFQVSVINLQEYVDKRREFDSDEWIDVLVNSCGLNPASMTRRQKLLYLCRCISLVEANYNMVELAPRETGKTYLYHNISYYAHVLPGVDSAGDAREHRGGGILHQGPSAQEILAWTITQDAMGGVYQDPVVVPAGVAEWICATMQPRRVRALN